MAANVATATVERHRLLPDMSGEADAAHVRKADKALNPARLRAFLASIEKPSGIDGCWLWRGSVNSDGYPSGRPGGIPHRLAYEWMVGEIPHGMELDHLCRNRACVNPHHLEPVTRAENMRRSRIAAGPFTIRRYCRKGHVLDAQNGRIWSTGNGRIALRCYECHDGDRRRG